MITYITMCSGIDAVRVAWEPLGFKQLACSEIEKFPCRLLAHHYPEVPNHGDFTMADWSQYQGVDIVAAGTPCQAFSVAGLRGSLSDARGNLTLEFIHAINAIQPRVILWENVPGVLSTGDNAFGCFLAGLVGCDEPIVAERGWPNAGVVHGPQRAAAWRVLDAQYFGLAQRRKRVFVVASPRDGIDPAQVLLEFESLRRDSPPVREAGEGVAMDAAPCLTRSGRGVERTGESRGQDPLAAVLYNAEGSEGATLTKSNIGNHLNNQTPLVVTHSLRGEGHDASEDGTGRGVPLVPVVAGTLGGGSGARGYPDSPDVTTFIPVLAQTISAEMYRSGGATGGNNPGVRNVIPVATIAIRGRNGESNLEVGTDGVANTILTPNGGRGGIGVGAIQHGWAVRRLTPRECERLQGFTDDYTLVPGAADGPRYKALGNSMAVPVIAWIGQRIKNQLL